MANFPPLRGVYPILPTPFLDDESLDLPSLDRTIRFFAELGVQGVTLLGVLGESNRLTDAERSELVRTAVAAAGELPVIVGCSHTGTAATLALARDAVALGAAAVMIAPSKQPVPNEATVFDYYRRIADAISVPIVLQDHPASTEVHMAAPLLLRLIREVPSIAAVKAEAVPSPQKIAALRKGMERPVPILTGLGALYGFFDLECGSDGFNTGFAFPEILLTMLAASQKGAWQSAYSVYQRYLPLIVFEQQPGLAIRKEILRRRGLLASGRVRHPGGNLDAGTAAQLDSLLRLIFEGTDLTKPLQVQG